MDANGRPSTVVRFYLVSLPLLLIESGTTTQCCTVHMAFRKTLNDPWSVSASATTNHEARKQCILCVHSASCDYKWCPCSILFIAKMSKFSIFGCCVVDLLLHFSIHDECKYLLKLDIKPQMIHAECCIQKLSQSAWFPIATTSTCIRKCEEIHPKFNTISGN